MNFPIDRIRLEMHTPSLIFFDSCQKGNRGIFGSPFFSVVAGYHPAVFKYSPSGGVDLL